MAPLAETKVGRECEGTTKAGVKKDEGPTVDGNRMNALRVSLAVTLWAGVALAQEDFTPPPMVPSETPRPELPPPPPTPPPEPEAAPAPLLEIPAPTVANAPLDSNQPSLASRAEPPGRPLRIGMGLLLGAGAGVVVGLAGLGVGTTALPADFLSPLGNGLSGMLLGFLVGVPIGVVVAGLLFDGTGTFWATLAGELVGLAIGAAAVMFGGLEGAPVCFAVPLLGAVIGYEASSAESRAAVAPVIGWVTGRGPVLGLAGRF